MLLIFACGGGGEGGWMGGVEILCDNLATSQRHATSLNSEAENATKLANYVTRGCVDKKLILAQ